METIRRIKIIDVLKREDYGSEVNVKGWVRTRRGSKSVHFIALNDGSTINNVQIVADADKFDDELIKLITTGACLSVTGELVQSVSEFSRRRFVRRLKKSCAVAGKAVFLIYIRFIGFGRFVLG